MIDPPETDAPKSEIAGVLYIGETRARLLAEAGIRTMDDLRAADAAQIGSVKGIGLKNGQRIKDWLAEHDAPAPALPLAIANQAVQDDSQSINTAFARIQKALSQGVAHKKLDKQIDKLLIVLSELAEAADTLRPKQFQRTIKMLHLIGALLDQFADLRPSSEKVILAFTEELRDRRRRLQKVLDPKK
jgi:hypothetical protein